MTKALVDRLRALPWERRLALYRLLPPGGLASQRYSHAFWARADQALPPPAELALIELVTGARRRGKSQWASWLFLREWSSGRGRMPRIVASTEGAIEDTLINGPAGLWTWLPWDLRARVDGDLSKAFLRSKGYGGVFQIPGLPAVTCLSAEKAGNAVGQGKDLTWADDPAAWVKVCGERKAREMFYELRVSTSEGARPCMIVSTTPGGVTFMRRAFSGDMRGVHKTVLREQNTALSPAYMTDVIGDMLGDGDDGDLTGEERLEAAGALWKWAWIDAHRCEAIREQGRVVAVLYGGRRVELTRIVVAVDPADTGKLDSDETGIVVVGLGDDGRLYVLADYTGHWEAEHWAAIAAWAFREYRADAVVCEINRAESTVRQCMRIELPNAPVIGVDAKKGKDLRAEPLTLLYRDGQVSHVSDGPQLSNATPVHIVIPVFDPVSRSSRDTPLVVRRDRRRWSTLEDELCGWVPRESRSPNGADALTMACAYLRPPDAGGPWAPTPIGPSRFGTADPRAPVVLPAWPRRPIAHRPGAR